MRATAFGLAALTVVGVMACSRENGRDRAGSADDLAKDLAIASSSDGITLAPTSGGRSTISSVEQLRAPVSRVAPSARTSSYRRASRAAEVAPVAPEPTEGPAVVEAPAPQPQQSAEPEVAVSAPRPHPVDGSGSGNGGGDRGVSVGIGDVIGVILRGGTVGDDDMCDPRPGRRGGGIIISGGQGGNAGGGVIIRNATPLGGTVTIRGIRF